MLQLQFYWDVYFILNGVMNLFLLLMTGMTRRKTIKLSKMILAALLGSAELTVFTIIELRFYRTLRFLYGGVLIFLPMAYCLARQMLRVSFGRQQRSERQRNLLAFLKISVLTGGALLLGGQWMGKTNLPGIWMVLAGTLLLVFVFGAILHRTETQEQMSHVMDGTLYDDRGKAYPIRVLVDTGNHLVSPYSGEKVAILQKTLGEEMGLARNQHPLWIPFHSIGGEGVLPAYRIPALILQNGEEKKNLLAAVTSDMSKDVTIKLILYSER